MERRFAVHARAYRQALIVALALVGGSASAAPKKGAAKVQFDRGVAAYTRGDFAGASEALGKSFEAQPDPETLFAWAQTERKLDHCDKAVELYGKLLTFDLPAENKDAIQVQVEECKQVLAQSKPDAPAVTPQVTTPAVAAPVDDTDTPLPTAKPVVASPHSAEGRPWYRDPVGDTLLVTGLIGLGVGATFLVSASAADADKAHAANYADFKQLDDRAKSRGELGVIAGTAGGVLVVGGIVWYATHRGDSSRTTVSGWVAPGTSGFAVAGRF